MTAVPGAERHHIKSWPWVGTPGDYTPGNEASFLEMVNAETGETSRAVVHEGESRVRCGVLTCVGVRPDRTAFMRLRDGTRERDLPAIHPGMGDGRLVHYPLWGKNVIIDLSKIT